MSVELESYVLFLKRHHLPKLTKYFLNEILCSNEGEIHNFFKIQHSKVRKHFKHLLDALAQSDYFEESIEDIHQLKKQINIISDDDFLSWYIAYLKNNKNTLIHFIPFYTGDWNSTIQLIKDIEDAFSKLEIEVLNREGIVTSNTKQAIDHYLESELRETSEQLRIKEEQLLASQKIAKVGSFLWDLKNDKVTGTDELYRIFGIENEKVSIKKIQDFVDKRERKAFRLKLIKALKKKGLFESEFKIVIKNKEEKYIVARTKSVHDNNGRAIQMLGILMDVTSLKTSEIEIHKKSKEIRKTNKKLKKAKEKLKQINANLDERVRIQTKELSENNDRYTAFIKHSTEGIWRYDFKNIGYVNISLPIDEQVELIYANAYFAECNERMAKLHGFKSNKELYGQFLSSPQFVSASIEEKKIFIKEFINSNYKLNDFNTSVVNNKGQSKYFQSSLTGIVKDGKLYGAWGIQRDITENKRAQQAIKESEERYKFLAENMPMIFWTASPNGEFDYANQQWYDFTKAKSFTNENWKDYIHKDDLKRVETAICNTFINGDSFEEECRLKRADGVYRWHLGRAVPLLNEYGSVIKWMGTMTDIHEQKTINDKLDKKNKELNKINNELDNLLYSVSHDLKAPVANIEGLIEALTTSLSEECKRDHMIQDLMDMMVKSVEKFKKNLHDTIDIAKAQKRGEEIAEENEMNDIIEDVKSDIINLIETTNTKIHTDFSKCRHIYFSSKNLKSIVYNLLSNAIKYRSPERNPEIHIFTEETTKFKSLTVVDNGLGFETDQLTDLTSNRLYKHIEGSGIGLYILKKIMENAGGFIRVDSKKGEGSKFTACFPKGE